MTKITIQFAKFFIIVGSLILLPLILFAQTDIETKGIPFKSTITDEKGQAIATINFFGEGTTKIHFEGNQSLALKDKRGKIVAGFEVIANDPKVARPTQLYLYDFKEGGKSKTLAMEHEVAKVEYRDGQYKIEGGEMRVLTSFFAGEKQLSVNFKDTANQKMSNSQIVNTITFASPEGDQFVFSIEPSSAMQCRLKAQKGDIVKYLRAKQKMSTSKSN